MKFPSSTAWIGLVACSALYMLYWSVSHEFISVPLPQLWSHDIKTQMKSHEANEQMKSHLTSPTETPASHFDVELLDESGGSPNEQRLLQSATVICPPGYQAGLNSCYLSGPMCPWTIAKEYCASSGGWLVKITSEEENTLITTFGGPLEKWIGLTASGSGGTWRWDNDGSLATYLNWDIARPDNLSGGANCVQMDFMTIGRWYDRLCTSTARTICEIFPLCSPPLFLDVTSETCSQCARNTYSQVNSSSLSDYGEVLATLPGFSGCIPCAPGHVSLEGAVACVSPYYPAENGGAYLKEWVVSFGELSGVALSTSESPRIILWNSESEILVQLHVTYDFPSAPCKLFLSSYDSFLQWRSVDMTLSAEYCSSTYDPVGIWHLRLGITATTADVYRTDTGDLLLSLTLLSSYDTWSSLGAVVRGNTPYYELLPCVAGSFLNSSSPRLTSASVEFSRVYGLITQLRKHVIHVLYM